MSKASEQMKVLDAEISAIREQIANLQIQEATLVRLKSKLAGDPEPESSAPRKRAAGVKPMVLDIIRKAGDIGMTSADVSVLVRERMPDVSKDTVGSVLSRLKSDGAFVYVGERYYEKQFAPAPETPGPSLRAVV